MQIIKRYFDECDWLPVDQETAAKHLAGFYLDPRPVLEEIAAGHVVYTDVAEYKRTDSDNRS